MTSKEKLNRAIQNLRVKIIRIKAEKLWLAGEDWKGFLEEEIRKAKDEDQ